MQEERKETQERAWTKERKVEERKTAGAAVNRGRIEIRRGNEKFKRKKKGWTEQERAREMRRVWMGGDLRPPFRSDCPQYLGR